MDGIYEKAKKRFEQQADFAYTASPFGAIQRSLNEWATKMIRKTGAPVGFTNTLGISEEIGELSEEFLGMEALQNPLAFARERILVLALSARVGRVAHAVLKHAQGLRGFSDEDKFKRKVADAVADIAVFSMQLCTNLGLDYATIVEETAREVMQRNWKQDPVGAGGNGKTEPPTTFPDAVPPSTND